MTDDTTAPIGVNGTPTRARIEAVLRQLFMCVGTLLTVLGYSHLAGRLSMLDAMAGPAAQIVALGWSWWAATRNAKRLAITAAAAPDSVAYVK